MKLFLRFEFEKILKFFRTKTSAKLITSALFLVVFLFVGLGIYFFFVSAFRFINAEAVEDIRLALTLFIYEVFLLVLALVIVFSSMISGLFNLFQGQNNNWLISSPGYRLFPKVVLVRSLLSSLLPSMVMFLPAIFAFIKVFNAGLVSVIFIAVSVMLLLLLLNALTLSFLLGVTLLYHYFSKKVTILKFSFGGLLGVLASIFTALGIIFWKVIRDVDLVKVFKADEDTATLSVTNIANYFNFLPTHPFAMEILSLQSGLYGEVIVNFLILTLITLLSILLWFSILPLFYPVWLRFQEGNSQKTTVGQNKNRSSRAYHFTGGTTMALFKKEVLISSRNFKGVLWFLFLLGIWLLQIAANVILENNVARYESDISQKIIILQALQFVIAIYFISSFTLRFVFPSFSAERRAAWILATAPLSFTKIFFGKYLFYTSFFAGLGVLMSYINSLILNIPLAQALHGVLLLVVTIIFIVTLGLSLGALFPNTETDDSETISTSMPGLFFTAISLMYGSLSGWILYKSLLALDVTWLIIFTLITVILGIVLLFITPRWVQVRIS